MSRLVKELAYFATHAEEWDVLYAGRFVVVKGDSLLGTFSSMGEALAAGAREFGLSDFLVREIGQPAPAVSIPALTLGLLSADSQRSTQRSAKED